MRNAHQTGVISLRFPGAALLDLSNNAATDVDPNTAVAAGHKFANDPSAAAG